MVSLATTLKPFSPFSPFVKQHNTSNNALLTYNTYNSKKFVWSKRRGSVTHKKHVFVAVQDAPDQVKKPTFVAAPDQVKKPTFVAASDQVKKPTFVAAPDQVESSWRIPLSEVVVVGKKRPFWERNWNYWDMSKLVIFVGLHLLSISAPFYFNWAAFRVFLCLAITNGICITLSYHRNLSHRSFELPKWLEYLFAYGGVLAFEGDPIEWVSNHRYHHKHCETERDPHSPTQGFWFSHVNWIFDTGAIVKKCGGQENVDDLLRQPFYRFLQRTFLLHQLAFALLVYFCGGMPFLVWGIGVASVVRLHTTFLGTSVCHIWGTRAWNTPDFSKNNWLVAIMTLGDGWHNNHHAFEFSARHGLEWWQVDVTWYIIRFLEVIGLATNVKLPTESHKKRMAIVSNP